jgi:Xaa-Pro aminopeptidase
MLTSNEPGFYKADEYGIRIENLDLCVEKMETDTGKFYTFEPQTLFPIATDLILLPLLSTEERQWLNEYHARVLKELSPLLNSAEQAWLEKKCRQV